MQTRFYSPILQRFLSEDASGLSGGINLYAFAAGDPVNAMDPFGLGPVNTASNQGTLASVWNWMNTPIDLGPTGNTIANALNPMTVLQTVGSVRNEIVRAGSDFNIAPPEITGAVFDTSLMLLGDEFLPPSTASVSAAETTVANEGIYEFTAASGKTYVGQSGDIAARLEQHLASGKLLEADLSTVETTEVLGGKTAREIAEQLRINELGGVNNLENVRNPIGPARQYLLQGTGTP
jgi:uncharacterized protein RhaS with RHS repeats